MHAKVQILTQKVLHADADADVDAQTASGACALHKASSNGLLGTKVQILTCVTGTNVHMLKQ